LNANLIGACGLSFEDFFLLGLGISLRQRGSSRIAALTPVAAMVDLVGRALIKGNMVTNTVRIIDVFMVFNEYEVVNL
jgi:hypothetical protein